MNNALTTTNNTAIQPIGEDVLLNFLDTLGIGANLDEKEKKTFLNIAKAFNLNPFKREIHVAKYGSNPMSLITGYEVYIKRAERTGKLNGWNVEISGSVESNDLTAAITIHRTDQEHPFTWEVYYDECVQRKGNGEITAFWKKPKFMLKKVAISQGFRLCFSDELAGMPYTADEMPEPAQATEDAVYTEVTPTDSRKTMKVGDKLFVAAIKALKEGKDMEQIKAAVIISPEVEKELNYALEQAA